MIVGPSRKRFQPYFDAVFAFLTAHAVLKGYLWARLPLHFEGPRHLFAGAPQGPFYDRLPRLRGAPTGLDRSVTIGSRTYENVCRFRTSNDGMTADLFELPWYVRGLMARVIRPRAKYSRRGNIDSAAIHHLFAVELVFEHARSSQQLRLRAEKRSACDFLSATERVYSP
jgi:hypothetical protein